MSRTRHGSKGCGYDFWSRRMGNESGCQGHGRVVKNITHRRERRRDKRLAYKLLVSMSCCLAMIGCDITRPVNVDEAKRPVKPDTPVVEVIDVPTAFHELAEFCTKTPTLTPWINTPHRLSRTVRVLEGRVPGVSAKFDELFENEASSDRPLTDSDISKLRSVK